MGWGIFFKVERDRFTLIGRSCDSGVAGIEDTTKQWSISSKHTSYILGKVESLDNFHISHAE